ncbi:hypothetical protein HY227_00635, partial [Candidatus Wolfebacteria bacterium]|nr:hypothetical protein [Candidatus Wolfebacteria bacterium]
QMVQKVYKIGMGVAGASALGVIIFGAVIMLLSGGNASKRQEGMEWIKAASYGLLLLLGSYIILRTINPDLIDIGKTQERMDTSMPAMGVPGGGSPASNTGTPKCSNCVPFSQWENSAKFNLKDGKDGSWACAGGRSNCQLPQEVVNKLNRLSEEADKLGLKRSDWQVTEGFPPTVPHIDSCHNNGTCVDIALTDKAGATQDKVNKLMQAARNAGFGTVVNEYKNFGGKTYATTKGDNIHTEL